MSRSLNKVQLIGNLARDPELRYTPQGTAVCTFTVATNRQWVSDGQKQEQAEFTRCVAWQKLAEICGQYLSKGRRVFVEGRLQTRKWTGKDGVDRYTTEVVINDMLMLDAKGSVPSDDFDIPDDMGMADDMGEEDSSDSVKKKGKGKKKEKEQKSESKKSNKKTGKKNEKSKDEDVEDDIPF